MNRILAAAAVVLVLGACATNPATGRRQIILMSESQEIALGRQSDADIRKQMGVYRDPAWQAYVDSLGQRLARQAHRPNIPWTFTIVDEQAVNAFALPGGFIYVTRGILPFLRDEAELANVIGHEVGHVDARHGAQDYSRQTLAGVGLAVGGVLAPVTQPFQGLASAGLQIAFLKNSRGHELEADSLGVGYASHAGWDPRGMPALLGTLGRLENADGATRGIPNWALTHPPAEDRIAKVQEAVVTAQAAGGTATNVDDYARRLDGLVYGDSREKGIVRGNEFLHPVLRFAVRFPSGWEITNGADAVTAEAGGQSNLGMVLQPTPMSGSLRQSAASQMSQAGWTETSGERADINGLDAYVATYEKVTNGTRAVIRAAHVQAGSQMYVIAGVAPAARFPDALPTFTGAIRTFRTLSQAEADRIEPDRISFHLVQAGETWDAIARGPGGARVKAGTLAIINGSDPAVPPRPGTRVRIVIGG